VGWDNFDDQQQAEILPAFHLANAALSANLALSWPRLI